MYNNATFVDKEQLKNLKKMDDFVKDNMVRFGEDVSEKLRELITKIIEKGHYYEAEADVLNMIGNEYNQWKKENR
jgi:division protein CdvB (Snf7/Vps24/ESCRT-III family)